VSPKPILKELAKIFDHKDKNVRVEGTLLAVELYRWIGPAMKNSLSDLKPVQVSQ
jgi:cytoskeleton-associated protein 5